MYRTKSDVAKEVARKHYSNNSGSDHRILLSSPEIGGRLENEILLSNFSILAEQRENVLVYELGVTLYKAWIPQNRCFLTPD